MDCSGRTPGCTRRCCLHRWPASPWPPRRPTGQLLLTHDAIPAPPSCPSRAPARRRGAPRRVQPNRDRQQPEIGDRDRRKQSRADGTGQRQHQDRGKTEVLPDHDAGDCSPVCAGPAEQHRRHNQVIDIRHREQPHRLADDPATHEQPATITGATLNVRRRTPPAHLSPGYPAHQCCPCEFRAHSLRDGTHGLRLSAASSARCSGTAMAAVEPRARNQWRATRFMTTQTCAALPSAAARGSPAATENSPNGTGLIRSRPWQFGDATPYPGPDLSRRRHGHHNRQRGETPRQHARDVRHPKPVPSGRIPMRVLDQALLYHRGDLDQSAELSEEMLRDVHPVLPMRRRRPERAANRHHVQRQRERHTPHQPRVGRPADPALRSAPRAAQHHAHSTRTARGHFRAFRSGDAQVVVSYTARLHSRSRTWIRRSFRMASSLPTRGEQPLTRAGSEAREPTHEAWTAHHSESDALRWNRTALANRVLDRRSSRAWVLPASWGTWTIQVPRQVLGAIVRRFVSLLCCLIMGSVLAGCQGRHRPLHRPEPAHPQRPRRRPRHRRLAHPRRR